MSECEKCHGEGTIPCSACKGKKTESCKKCKGTGKVTCYHCDGDGVVTCGECYGTGKKLCPVCCKGKVKKKRWINCSACHGTGQVEDWKFLCCVSCGIERLREKFDKLGECPTCGSRAGTRPAFKSCEDCDGRGQVEETYYELCPNCHGDYANYSKDACPKCDGDGTLTCGACHGEKFQKCGDCKGSGHVTCSHCKGSGKGRCPDCERREKERQEREAAQKRREAERVERVKQAAIETERARQAKQHQAEERRDTYIGCGCLLAVIAVVAFVIWWWIEGLTIAALSEMWTKAINCVGGVGGIATLVCGLAALFFVWKLVKRMKGSAKKSAAKSTSSKKRWKFVVLGLLFGFLGVHLAYAKRWTLFLLLWAGLVTGGSFGTSDDAAKPPTDAAAQVQQTEQQKSKNSTISNVGFAVWALLWIGGTLFIKKDGKGNRM